MTCILACAPAVAGAATASNGGASPDDARYRPAAKAKIVNGLAIPPRSAPPRIKRAMEAANDIVRKPYKYGGGHASVKDRGYDCSGTISYALIGAGLLKRPLDSGSFMSWAQKGKGKWISVYAHGGHAYAIIAGLRLDTSVGSYSARRATRRKIARSAFERGPRWRPMLRSAQGFAKRHPVGL